MTFLFKCQLTILIQQKIFQHWKNHEQTEKNKLVFWCSKHLSGEPCWRRVDLNYKKCKKKNTRLNLIKLNYVLLSEKIKKKGWTGPKQRRYTLGQNFSWPNVKAT